MVPDPLDALIAAGVVTPAVSPRRAPERDEPLADVETIDAWLAWSRADFDDPKKPPR